MQKNYICFLNIFMVLIAVPFKTDGARILCVFQLPAPSHHRIFDGITRGLLRKGHEIISVTPLPMNDSTLKNLTEIVLNYPAYVSIFDKKFVFNWSKELPIYERIARILLAMDSVANKILQYDSFRKIYTDKNEKFDLIIVQTYLSPVMFALSEKLKAPIIGVSSLGLWSGSHIAAGNPNPPSIYTDMFLPYNGDLRYHIHYVSMPRAQKIARKHFGTNLPSLGDIERNVSAWFMNINPILYTPRPLVPTVIPLNFLHIEPAKTLPEDLQREIDTSPNGFVYFSMGTSVRGINIPEKVTILFMQVMAELPYKILWKFENEQVLGKPRNVLVRTWFPQQDVLAHPKIKIFVSQCGLHSLGEAVHREVPMICIPFISDQEMNSNKLAKLGVIRQIDYLNTTKDELLETINEVAENPIYRRRMKEIRQIILDEPMSGTEKAVWWAEYIIRHKGTKHLRSPTIDIEWYKYLLLDVVAVIIGVPLIVLISLCTFTKVLLRSFKNKECKNKKQ